MVMMDHATRLVYIRCIPTLSRYVALELNQIFGLIGYPDILHISDLERQGIHGASDS
jgi:hypothetical protein